MVEPMKLDSIRNGIIGSLSDFITESKFGVVELELIVELVYELSNYREEDVAFYPNVYIVKRSNNVDALSIIAPSADRIPLGQVTDWGSAGAVVLKNSASLAEEGWSIYIEIGEDCAKYGVFRSEQLPISISSSEVLADPDTGLGIGILIRNCAKNCVQLLTGAGRRMEFALTSAKPSSEPISNAFAQLAMELTKAIDNSIQPTVRQYFERLLFRIIQRCHGTLIAVVPAELGLLPTAFSDGVVLQEPIDFVSALLELQEHTSASALARLESMETILRGMVHNDGITILSADGKIRAFRIFVRATEEERSKMDGLDIRGGARSRAYEILKLRLGNPLTCVFFRSQDGKTNCMVNL